jgi:hypothetical protein
MDARPAELVGKLSAKAAIGAADRATVEQWGLSASNQCPDPTRNDPLMLSVPVAALVQIGEVGEVSSVF